ncbi:MAG TPA: hypothetical protein VJQ55_07595 [Candidatus Binatia bacterium]|nr:hypothetical protein [Candidatus Binatia bacterium]
MVEPNQPSNYYARVLRAIGQDLADLFPQQLEIELKERTFVVQVRCDRKRSEHKAATQATEQPKAAGLRGFFHKLNTIRLDKPPDKPEIVTVNRTYNPIDISRIDESGLHRRIQVGKIPDIHDLGESLRTVGRILDAEEGRLVKILRDQRRVMVEYIARGGQTKKIELSRAELVKIHQDYYHGRSGPGSLDHWRNKD